MSRDYGSSAKSVSPISDHPNYDAAGSEENESGIFQGLSTKAPEKPADMTQSAGLMWDRVVPQLEAAGILAEVDYSILRRYCETWALYFEAQKDIEMNGEWQTTKNGYLQMTPAAIARSRHASDLTKLEGKLFLNPYSRKSLKIVDPSQVELDF